MSALLRPHSARLVGLCPDLSQPIRNGAQPTFPLFNVTDLLAGHRADPLRRGLGYLLLGLREAPGTKLVQELGQPFF